LGLLRLLRFAIVTLLNLFLVILLGFLLLFSFLHKFSEVNFLLV
jgi:hypothetical protein